MVLWLLTIKLPPQNGQPTDFSSTFPAAKLSPSATNMESFSTAFREDGWGAAGGGLKLQASNTVAGMPTPNARLRPAIGSSLCLSSNVRAGQCQYSMKGPV